MTSVNKWTRSSTHFRSATFRNGSYALSVSVYYVAVRTIVLSRHGSNLARPVIIHDIIHGLIYVPSTPCCEFLGFRRMETAPTSIEVLLRPTHSQSDEPSDLRGSLSPTSVYSTWQSQAVTHPIMNRARRCLTSVLEHKALSERRIIPYMWLDTHLNNQAMSGMFQFFDTYAYEIFWTVYQ